MRLKHKLSNVIYTESQLNPEEKNLMKKSSKAELVHNNWQTRWPIPSVYLASGTGTLSTLCLEIFCQHNSINHYFCWRSYAIFNWNI